MCHLVSNRLLLIAMLGLLGVGSVEAQIMRPQTTRPMSPAQTAQADPYAARIMMGPESYTWQSARGVNTMQGRTAQNFYGQSAATVAQRGVATKPFNTVVNEPVISPYMNLYREQSAVDVPNYQLFVRPQQEQLEANRRQQTAVGNLQRQIQQTSYNAPATGRPYSTAARYGDTRQYYGGFNR